MADIMMELRRKAFHMLSLAYLAAYQLIGYPRVLAWLWGWSALVVVAEFGRLWAPAVNEALLSFFSGIIRGEERRHVSGLLHTTLGALFVIAGFGDRPRIVAASLCCVAFGDAAAAIVGKTVGRRRLPGSKKTLEGSLACFAACALVGWALGFPAPAALAAALIGTAIEVLPTTPWFNDNLWMPAGTAVVLRLLV